MSDVRITWDAVTTDINGDPETVVGYDVTVWSVTKNDSVTPIRTTDLGFIWTNLQEDSTYGFGVRAVDDWGNKSTWSTIEYTVGDHVPPAAPKIDVVTIIIAAGILFLVGLLIGRLTKKE